MKDNVRIAIVGQSGLGQALAAVLMEQGFNVHQEDQDTFIRGCLPVGDLAQHLIEMGYKIQDCVSRYDVYRLKFKGQHYLVRTNGAIVLGVQPTDKQWLNTAGSRIDTLKPRVRVDSKSETRSEERPSEVEPKQPIGLMPENIYTEKSNDARIDDILSACVRYRQAGKQIPPEWAQELLERLE
ncbi:hypothetical protein VPHK469_0178 [Vibrio phage K469]